PSGEREADDPPRAAATLPPDARQLGEGHHLGAAEVGRATMRTGRERLDRARSRFFRGDGLETPRYRQRHERPALDGEQRAREQLVELRGAEDRVADAAREDDLLARELSAVVDERDPVDADDRYVEEMRDAGAPRRIEQTLRPRDIAPAETDAGVRCGVQDGIHSLHRCRDPRAGRQVAI